jgi:hypothetical protein
MRRFFDLAVHPSGVPTRAGRGQGISGVSSTGQRNTGLIGEH